jgi:hypothetical protein
MELEATDFGIICLTPSTWSHPGQLRSMSPEQGRNQGSSRSASISTRERRCRTAAKPFPDENLLARAAFSLSSRRLMLTLSRIEGLMRLRWLALFIAFGRSWKRS